jgi:Asp-tRNA(Asn)/Glu-tRNA(Gln) amidotransferase A subunit family amidase
LANDSLPLIGAGRLRLLGLVLAAAVASCLPARRAAPSMARFRVLLETSKGPIVIEVIPDWAPRGADRFRELVTAGYYDDARFFRVVKDRWAQFGINGDPAVAKRWRRFHLVEATIDDIQAQYRAGNLRPEDVVRMYLARIAAYDRSNVGQPLNGGVGQQPLNSFMHVNEQAIRDAHRLGDDFDDFDEGDDDDGGKPLFGIPVILKDNIATSDMPTTAGSVALGGSDPKKDAFIARKLRRAGAIILGKGTLTEFANFIALGMPTGFSSQLRFQLFQAPGADLSKVGYGFNSYDPRIDPRTTRPLNDGRPVLATGGSSSGPGIAVGANLATVGVGTETSGSILSPSGQNSLVGIKPTLGLVSRHGIVPITADQDTAGPMTRTVTDAARLLGVLAGFDEKDPATAACHTPGKCFRDYTQFLDPNALKGAHIAVPKHPYWIEFGLGAARTALMNDAIATMTSLGATVETCEIPSQDVLNNYGTCVTTSDVAARRATPAGAIPSCSTVLLFGFKRDLNTYPRRQGLRAGRERFQRADSGAHGAHALRRDLLQRGTPGRGPEVWTGHRDRRRRARRRARPGSRRLPG